MSKNKKLLYNKAMEKIKYRVTFAILLLLVILTSTFSYITVTNKQRLLDEKITSHKTVVRSAFDKSLLDIQKSLNTLACDISKDTAIAKAFYDRDRELLYKLTMPLFKSLKDRGDVDLSGFIDADGYHFLRMQEPERYGDNITNIRPILAYAIASKERITSVDTTIFGSSVVAIMPIYHKGEFVGIIQTVSKIERLQDRLNAQSGVKSAISIKKEQLEREIDKKDYKIINNYAIVSSNDELFNILDEHIDLQQNSHIELGLNDYIITARTIENYANEVTGMVICAFDITETIQKHNQDLIFITIVSILSAILIVTITYFTFKFLLKKILIESVNSKRLSSKLYTQLYTDQLTGLQNRKALIRDMSDGGGYALVLLNIDNFKEINDFYGYTIGDNIIVEFAHTIKDIASTKSIEIYKMPSDEIALLFNRQITSNELDALVKELIATIEAKEFIINDISIHISISAGAEIAIRSVKQDVLLQNADIALKFAKKNQIEYQLYDDTMMIKKEIQKNIEYTKKLKKCIKDSRLTLYYQPIFDHKDYTITKYEALLRIIDEDGAILSPFHFLDVAKKSKLYPQITLFVIDEVFKQLATTPHRFSINISIDDILNKDIKELLIQKMAQGNYANRLTLEILESEGITNYNEIAQFITDVKEFGCEIAIDDFGTGYSNFSHIMRLNVDYIKIDGSLIKNIDTDVNYQNTLGAITELSRRMNVKTVAEFVHSEAVAHKCIELGVNYLQGFYLGEPQPLS